MVVIYLLRVSFRSVIYLPHLISGIILGTIYLHFMGGVIRVSVINHILLHLHLLHLEIHMILASLWPL